MDRRVKIKLSSQPPKTKVLRPRRYIPLNGDWNAQKWVIGGTRPGLRDSDVVLDWKLLIDKKSTIAKKSRQQLMKVCKDYLGSLMSDPPPGTRPFTFLTVRNEYFRLRTILKWMMSNHFTKFSEIESDAVMEFLEQYAKKDGRKSRSSRAVVSYANVFRRLFLQRHKLKDALREDPFHGGSPGRAVEHLGKRTNGWKPLPDEIAIKLITHALRMIGKPADDLLTHRDIYGRAFDAAHKRTAKRKQAYKAAVASVANFKFSVLPGENEPWYPDGPKTIERLAQMNRHLLSACAVVILYLCGPRVSELLQLGSKSLTWKKHSDGRRYPYFQATLAKSGGRSHRWVVSSDVKRAIDVMKWLSRPFREKTGFDNFWVRIGGNGIWPRSLKRSTACAFSSQAINSRLNGFARHIGIGKDINLTSHRGRKTFTRFIVRRDKSGLYPLSRHFGHAHWLVTDKNYAGTDFELSDLIREEDHKDLRRSLEDLVSSPSRKGKGLRYLSIANNDLKFRGRTVVRKEVDRYIAAGVILAPCNWGYCVYRQETSACKGSSTGPDPTNRTPGTCARCENFCVTQRHAPWWQERKRVTEEALRRPGVHQQSRVVLKQRVAECDQILTDFSKRNVKDHKR